MGFSGPISADKLSATYDSITQTLTLYAEGTVPDGSYGFNFERDLLPGGLKFTLEGWTPPFWGRPEEPYKWQQAFEIQLPSRATPSNTVIIVTANHPNGEVVPIRWLELKNQPTKERDDITWYKSAPSEPQSLSTESVQLNELFKEPFTITHAAAVPKSGSVQIKFDPAFLTLTGAGIQDADINWTFNSLQTGNTTITVTVQGGVSKYTYQVVYNVRIFVLDGSPSFGAPKALTATLPATANGDDESLSFLGRVNIAVRLVQERYPDAQLYEVDATPNHPGSVNDPNELAHLKVVFNVRKNGEQGTAIIFSVGWGEFGPVQYVPKRWLGDAVIPWPPEGLTEPTKADAILKRSGYTKPYFSMTLRQPVYRGDRQPYYIFTLVNYTNVLVGAKDGHIKVTNDK